jgi:HK97 family phage portal protein
VLEQRAGLQTSYAQGGYGWMDPAAIPPPGMFNTMRAGVVVTQHTMLLVDVVFTALRIISNTIIKMGDLWPFVDAFSDDNVPYRKYQATRYPILFDTFGGSGTGGVGGAMMQCTGRDRTVWSMGLFGEAYWYVLDRERGVKKAAGLPSAVEVLHPAFMEVKVENGQPVFLYGSGKDRQTLDPDDVIYIPFKSMPQARRALSPITYAGVAGALAMAAYEFGSTWFSQGASPSFMLRTDQKLGQAEVDRIASKFAIEHSGLANAHLPLVLDNGLQADRILATPDEAQYLHTLEYSRNVLASWFGLPPSLLGNALERQTPQPAHTSEEETSRFLQYTLSGYMVPLEEAHSGLLPVGVKAAFNENALSRPDAQFLSQLIMALRQAQVASIDELRTRYMGLGPTADGSGASVIAPLASNTAPEQTKEAGA